LEWYDFFSGACFCVHSSMLDHYIRIGKPNEKDLEHLFPWMWERMWGTIPLYLGGRLIHYKDWRWNRIEEYHPRPHKRDMPHSCKLKKFSRSFSRLHFEDLSVVKKEINDIIRDNHDKSKLLLMLCFDVNLLIKGVFYTLSGIIRSNEARKICLLILKSHIHTLLTSFRAGQILLRLVKLIKNCKYIKRD